MTTNSTFQSTSAQTIPETLIHHAPLDQSQRAGITIWQNALRPMRCDDIFPAHRDLCNGLVPGDPFKLVVSLRSDSPHRREQSLCMIHPLKVTIHLCTEPA